jgi:hypothetical protein
MRRLFEVNSEPHTGARPSVRLCVGLTNTPASRPSESLTGFSVQPRPSGASAFRVFQYSVVLPNFSTEWIKQSKAQIERPQSTRDAPCHIPMATQTASALWLALAGGHHRVTAVVSKAKVIVGQSSVVLSNHHRGARKAS